MKIVEIKSFDLLALHRYKQKRYPFLLESVRNQTHLGKYSFLFAFPEESIVLPDLEAFDFFDKLNHFVRTDKKSSHLPFVGGYFVYLSYEMNGQIEPRLKTQAKKLLIDETAGAIAYATKIPTAIIVDHFKQKSYLIDETGDDVRLNAVLADIKQLTKTNTADSAHSAHSAFYQSFKQPDDGVFIEMVRQCQHYIAQGDIFQANLSRLWQFYLDESVSASDIYQQLRLDNAASFAALVNYANTEIISSSPERLFQVLANKISTRPIAGTYPRGIGKADKTLSNALFSNEKERAEHIMLVDLERNDLGRICQVSSIKVNELMTVESYSAVHHLVSNISGFLKNDIAVGDIIKALFPGGSISGCPKVRSMEIIAALEKKARGAYTGSLGYISRCGNMDFNILIRSFTKHGALLKLRTGSGIVHDSLAEKELAETEHKARALLTSLKKKN